MSQDDNQQPEEQPAEAPAPDGLMAQAALAEEQQQADEQEPISHLAQDEEQPEGEEEEVVYERPDWFPEKHWSEKDGPDLEGLVKSNKELEKKFHHGDHKAPDDGKYDTEVLTEAGYDMDDPLVQTYVGWAAKYGINQAAFSELAGSISELAIENGAQIEVDTQAEHKALGNNADAIIKSNIDWADGLTRKGIISDAEREEMNIWGGTAVGQRLMQKVRQMTGDLSRIPIADVAEASESKADFNARMASMMADPKYRSDEAYRRSVEAEFYKRYPNN